MIALDEAKEASKTVGIGFDDVSGIAVRDGNRFLAIGDLRFRKALDTHALSLPETRVFVDVSLPVKHARALFTTQRPRKRDAHVVEAVEFGGLWYAVLWAPVTSEADEKDLGTEILPLLLALKGYKTPKAALAMCDHVGLRMSTGELISYLALTRALKMDDSADLDGVMPCHGVESLRVVSTATVAQDYGPHGFESWDGDDVDLGSTIEVLCRECGRLLWREGQTEPPGRPPLD